MPILNVEDYAPSRFLRTRILERAGFHVTEADTIAEATRICFRDPSPRLVLLDCRLPDGSGFDFCERVKSERPGTPVVMITSTYTTADARRDGFRAGADAYLLEPVSEPTFLRAIGKFVGQEPPARIDPALIVTDVVGNIVRVNDAASRVLNVSRTARGRSILPFFSNGRPEIALDMLRASKGMIVQRAVTIRPREKKPFTAALDLSEAQGELHWIIEPAMNPLTNTIVEQPSTDS
jgi:DNA-binding response OmpR family regulator